MDHGGAVYLFAQSGYIEAAVRPDQLHECVLAEHFEIPVPCLDYAVGVEYDFIALPEPGREVYMVQGKLLADHLALVAPGTAPRRFRAPEAPPGGRHWWKP